MNYLEWNNAIINHFFNFENEDKEVILYFSEDVIEEIGENNFIMPENGYVEDFFKAIRSGVTGTKNDDYIQRILDLEKRYSQGIREIDKIPFNYPPYLTYMLTFLLPFTSGELQEGINKNNFHKNAKSYFESKKIISNYNVQIKHRLKEIDYLWEEMFEWLFKKNNLSIGYIEKIENPAPNRKYVSKFEYHIIFRKEQEDQLSVVFDNNNILPNEPLNEKTIKQLLIDNAVELHLTEDIIDKIIKDEYVGDKLVKRVYNYYKNWDGSNRYDYSERTNAEAVKRGYSRKRMVLCLNFNLLLQEIEIKYFRIFSPDGLPDDSKLSDVENNVYNGIEQSLKSPLYSTPIENCFQNLEQSIELKDDANRIKYNWKAKDFYLFKRDSQLNDWVEIPQIEFNVGKTIIITKQKFYESNLSEWFNAENIPIAQKRLYSDSSKTKLPSGWITLTVDQISNYQHPTLPELKTATDISPKINFNKDFFFNACFYSDKLPNVWVESHEVESEEMFAEYEGGAKLPLKFDANSKTFLFTDNHLQKKGLRFKLKFGEIEYPRFIKIVEFENKKSNEEIELIQPKRNLIGNTVKPSEVVVNYFQGIEHTFESDMIRVIKPIQRNPVTQESIFVNEKDANSYIKNHNYNPTHKGNILLNYISEKGRISKAEYDSSIICLLKCSDEKENLRNLITNSIYDLQNLGYADYDAEQGLITVNKSSLVIIPTETGTTLQLIGARDNKFAREIIDYSDKGGYCVEIRESSTGLLPQRILIKFKSRNHKVAIEFANHFNLLLKSEEQLFTQFALSNAHNLSDWEKFVKDTDSLSLADDLEGGELFNINDLTFKDKPLDFDKEISLIRFDNINGYKKAYRLWYKNKSYHIAELHYGIYLFLYLYKELKTQEIESEKNRSDINSYECNEKKEFVKSQTNILLYDESKNWLGVPFTCRLPKYYSIAFTLLSGRKPVVQQYNNRNYLIYKNLNFLFCSNSLVTSFKQQLTKKHQIFV